MSNKETEKNTESFKEVTDNVDRIPDPEPMTDMEIAFDNIGMLNMRQKELETTIHELKQTLAVALAEIQNTKQLVGHVLGRGMGSTDPREGKSLETEK